jgi:hypothetical protein
MFGNNINVPYTPGEVRLCTLDAPWLDHIARLRTLLQSRNTGRGSTVTSTGNVAAADQSRDSSAELGSHYLLESVRRDCFDDSVTYDQVRFDRRFRWF